MKGSKETGQQRHLEIVEIFTEWKRVEIETLDSSFVDGGNEEKG